MSSIRRFNKLFNAAVVILRELPSIPDVPRRESMRRLAALHKEIGAALDYLNRAEQSVPRAER
jgi:hypothetical protein